MKRQRRTVGSFVRIDLGGGYFGYARILDKANYAIYNVISQSPDEKVEYLQGKDILFIVAVYDRAVTEGRWEKIGTLPLEEKLSKLPLKFIQDIHDPTKFELYDSNTGEIYPATRTECEGLEYAAVWEPEHVEDRIRDYFEGKSNVWVEQLKMK